MDGKYDVVLIGAGVMSATLATMLHEIRPTIDILIIESQTFPAMESSAAFNNAGTGHAGFCELNYSVLKDDKVDISKAIGVNTAFEQSKQLWATLVQDKKIKNDFVHQVPHISFVTGEENVSFLEKRYNAMKEHYLFQDIEFSKDFNVISEWCPLITTGRNKAEIIGATRVKRGLDVDYGNLTNQLFASLSRHVTFQFNSTVNTITKTGDTWSVRWNDSFIIKTDNVFVGAGGAALTLLQNANIPEIKKYGGFPVSGQWLICDNQEIVKQHEAKVYGKASIGSPPMSVPHLDTRLINGKKYLLFGPYAGFSTKFLKAGNWTDLFKSINWDNLWVMIKAGLNNFGLTKYLVSEVLKNDDDKFRVLKQYYPEAKKADWKLSSAGQRVQVIKEVNGKAVIEFGTEVVGSADGTIIGLLGASPGASTAVHIMYDVIKKMNLNLTTDELAELDSLVVPVTSENFKDVEEYTSTILDLK